MRHTFKLAIFAIAFTSSIVWWHPDRNSNRPLTWYTSLEQAWAESVLTRKPLLVSAVDDLNRDTWRQAVKSEELAESLRGCVLLQVDSDQNDPWFDVLGVHPGRKQVLLSWRGDELFNGPVEDMVTDIPQTLDLYYKSLNRAYKRFQNFADVNPEDPEGLYKLGELALACGHPDQAARAFRRILDLDPSALTDNAHLGLAAATWVSRGAGEAQTLFQVFLQKYPESEEYNLGRLAYGLVLRDLHREKDAAPYLATPL